MQIQNVNNTELENDFLINYFFNESQEIDQNNYLVWGLNNSVVDESASSTYFNNFNISQSCSKNKEQFADTKSTLFISKTDSSNLNGLSEIKEINQNNQIMDFDTFSLSPLEIQKLKFQKEFTKNFGVKK